MRKIAFVLSVILITLAFTTGMNAQLLEFRRQQVLETAENNEGYTIQVTDILSPTTLELTYVSTDGSTEIVEFELLGVKSTGVAALDQACMTEAMRLVYSDYIYIVYDENYPPAGREGYVYYADAWFLLNASLIDRGLLLVDEDDDHWLKDEFLNLQRNAREFGVGYWGLDEAQLYTDTGEDTGPPIGDDTMIEITRPDGPSVRIDEDSEEGTDTEVGIGEETDGEVTTQIETQITDNWASAIYCFDIDKLIAESGEDSIHNLAMFPDVDEFIAIMSELGIDVVNEIDLFYIALKNWTLTEQNYIMWVEGNYDTRSLREELLARSPDVNEILSRANIIFKWYPMQRDSLYVGLLDGSKFFICTENYIRIAEQIVAQEEADIYDTIDINNQMQILADSDYSIWGVALMNDYITNQLSVNPTTQIFTEIEDISIGYTYDGIYNLDLIVACSSDDSASNVSESLSALGEAIVLSMDEDYPSLTELVDNIIYTVQGDTVHIELDLTAQQLAELENIFDQF